MSAIFLDFLKSNETPENKGPNRSRHHDHCDDRMKEASGTFSGKKSLNGILEGESVMKGMMLAVAAVAGLAFADGVQSSNIVGYRAEDCTDKRYVSVKFWQTGNTEAPCSLLDVLDVKTLSSWEDTIEVYDADQSCDILFDWTGEAWEDTAGEELMLEVVPGVSFLVQSASAWNFVGEVPEMTVYDHVIDGPTYLGSAFPIEATYADFDWTVVEAWDGTLEIYDADEGADILYDWNGEAWENTAGELLDMSLPAEGALLKADVEKIVQTFPGYVAP